MEIDNDTVIQYTAEHDQAIFYGILSFWLNGVLSLTLVAVGTLGNGAIVLSLHCCRDSKGLVKRRRQAFYYYLMTFAFWNTGLLIATVLFNCIPALLKTNINLEALSSICHLTGYLLGNCCLTANIWLAVMVTVERYLAVSLPFHSTRLTSPRRRAKLVSVILSIGAILYNSPLVFEMTFNPRHESANHHPRWSTNSSFIDTDTQRNINRLTFNGVEAPFNVGPASTLDRIRLQTEIRTTDATAVQYSTLSRGKGRSYSSVTAASVMITKSRHRTVSDRIAGIDTDSTDLSAIASSMSDGQPASAAYELRMSTLRDNIYYQFAYRVVANMLFVSGLPFLVVLLLTVKIVWLVRESDLRRERFRKPSPAASSRKRSESPSSTFRPNSPSATASPSWRHAHVVLTLIAVKFLLCYSLPVVINIFELTIDQRKYESRHSAWSKALAVLVDLSNLLVVLDGATNAFFYFSWWRKRIRFKERFSRKKTTDNCTFAACELPDVTSEVAATLLRKNTAACRHRHDPHLHVHNAQCRMSPCISRNATLDFERSLLRKDSSSCK